MPWSTPIAPVAAAAQTTGGTGAAVDLGVCTTAVLDLTVSAASGTTPSLAVTVQTSKDNVVWVPLGSFDAVTTPGLWTQRLPGAFRYLRAAWSLSGTAPSFTFGVSGLALLVYATPVQFLKKTLAGKSLSDLAPDVIDEGLCEATDDVDAALTGPYTLPLAAWGDDVVRRVVDIATLRLLAADGFSPEGENNLIVKASDDAMSWLRQVHNETLKPRGIIDATPSVYDGGAAIVTRPKRGWGSRYPQ
jgi:phage gp36-like protein